MWSRGSHHLVSELGSINQVISFWNFCFLLIPQKTNFLNVQFLLLLDFAAYKKLNNFVILFYYCPKYISSIKKKEKKSFKKTFIGFCCRKLNKVKLDQINLELVQSWCSDYWVLIAPHIKFGVNCISFALVFNFGSNEVWFITFLRQYIKPYCKLLKLYIMSIWVDIALYVKF